MGNNELINQSALSTLKTAIGAIPFVGSALNELLFEIRGRIKQDRINKFIQAFSEYLSEHKEIKLEMQQVEKEEFGDFFEEVLIKVSKNHSEIKRNAFKILLANQLLNPNEINYAELMLRVIDSLHEKQIPILLELKKQPLNITEIKGQYLENEKQLEKLIDERKEIVWQYDSDEEIKLNPIVENIDKKILSLKIHIKELNAYLEEIASDEEINIYQISKDEDYYLVQDLCNKGLLIDKSMAHGLAPLSLLEITDLGRQLLDSI